MLPNKQMIKKGYIVENTQKKVLRFFRVNMYLSILALMLSFKIFGYNLTGYLWLIILLYSIYTIFTNKKIHFPILIWIPFVLYLSIYLIIDYSIIGLQAILQYFCPIIVGIAVSGLTYDENSLKKIISYFKRFAFFLIFYLIVVSYFRFGQAGIGTGATTILCTMVAVVILADFWITHKITSLLLYALLVLIPFLSITRTGMAMILVILPINFFRINLPTRFILLFITLIIAITIFYSSSFQQKSFFSGSGQITDISLDNPNFYTGGRTTLYSLLDAGLEENPIWGNGPRSELILFQQQGLELKESHNDYKAIRYGYGWVGLITLFLGFIGSFIYLFKLKSKLRNKYQRIFLTTALTLFIPLLGFMSTDNILKYTIYYSTFHFAFMAICFAEYKNNTILKEL